VTIEYIKPGGLAMGFRLDEPIIPDWPEFDPAHHSYVAQAGSGDWDIDTATFERLHDAIANALETVLDPLPEGDIIVHWEDWIDEVKIVETVTGTEIARFDIQSWEWRES
jgi:hypothetical protein